MSNVIKFLFSISVLFVASAVAASEVTVTLVDDDDSMPVSGATVMSGSGVILGVTDADGQIKVNDTTDFPLSLRSLGYKATSVVSMCDTVRLSPETYRLSEVSVNPADRPITRVLCYAREYSSGTAGRDTMQMYCESMTECFVTVGKVKGYDKTDSRLRYRALKRYARFVDPSGRDSVVSPTHDDDVSALSFLEMIGYIPVNELTLTDDIKDKEMVAVTQGKFFPSVIYRKDKNIFSVTCDHLANYKDHKFSPLFLKIFGLTLEMNQMQSSVAYSLNDSGRYGLSDFIFETSNIHAVAKGKLFKKIFHTKDPVEIDCYIELYPVEIQYLTIEEYKEMKNDKSRIDFQEPRNIQPLIPAMESLVEKVGKISSEK